MGFVLGVPKVYDPDQSIAKTTKNYVTPKYMADNVMFDITHNYTYSKVLVELYSRTNSFKEESRMDNQSGLVKSHNKLCLIITDGYNDVQLSNSDEKTYSSRSKNKSRAEFHMIDGTGTQHTHTTLTIVTLPHCITTTIMINASMI